MRKFYVITSWFNALIWLLAGLLTIGSMLLSREAWVINLVVGIVFLLLGSLFFLKVHFFVRWKGDHVAENVTGFSKYLMMESILTALILLFSLIILSAVWYRIFSEGKAIFG